jgi:hypothetical protein
MFQMGGVFVENSTGIVDGPNGNRYVWIVELAYECFKWSEWLWMWFE